MDDYFFQDHVRSCRNVIEATSYLEIFNYSDPAYNSVEEHPLTMDEFENFLHQRGAFVAPKLPSGVKLLNGCRIVLQLKAKHPETFTSNYISFTAAEYESMVRALHLPYRAIEGTSVVGPFFWCAHDEDDDDSESSKPGHLQIIMRKSDVRKKGKTRGWELMLSHDLATGLTSGYVKGTDSSDMSESIAHLRACARQAAHPFLLPMIILSHDLSPKTDQKQRDARDWLRRLEHAVSMRNEIVEDEGYVGSDAVMDLDQINRDLVECHSQVLWKRPQAYQEIIREMEKGMARFMEKLPAYRNSKSVNRCHKSMLSRLEFFRNKLVGIENYAHTTLERLAIQRSALYNIIAQKESKLNLQMAADQRRLAHASKRDSTSMKTISLLGAIFLPATLLASIFSMVFFNTGDSNITGILDGRFQVYSTFWIYFVITIPVTVIIVVIWWAWDRSRERRYKQEDVDLESQIDGMESKIMATMRRRTMNKVRTWTHAPEKVE
ncbi:hypothetical protein M406DRAFT_248876 [Cryphonectria parasitica EP155]|uniref:Uncharacterized protein n=1 Tax=Cryphonectria parasitica (strain ATCC 38755 / EP155) TaxID=660469 RepID=A0A9P4YAD8_CRYP1|nr:uncharacterized protein M406DRAFT_248876 [Cryphonectria parasitica EP155]KAF3769867.1 hypothetical protein M406DRAFT_248876 [Cryphonectria parasitica EP155]